MGAGPSTKVLRAPQTRKRRQQVAAVCYRIGRRGIEFLLVQTRGGRWIFPKGGVEPRLTLAQYAALEALEEAGVHGRIEEIPFARYFRRTLQTGVSDPATVAYLCEVTRREAPQEANRNPTWLSAEKAKLRLREDRASEFGRELARVIDRASSRIERLQRGARTPAHKPKDELQKVRFDYLEVGHFHAGAKQAALVRRLLQQHSPDAQPPNLPAIGAKEFGRKVLRLGAGADSLSDAARNVTAIDSALAASVARPGNLSQPKPKSSPQ
jgi:8-oxo-dGTP pyrophosphatase MutT (NUDIX family)